MYDDYEDTGIDVKEMIKESIKEISVENRQEQAAKQRAHDLRKAADEVLFKENTTGEELSAFEKENPQAAKEAYLKAHKKYISQLAQARKIKRNEVPSTHERGSGKWEATQQGSGMIAQRGVKYHASQDLKQRAAAGDTTAFDDMVSDIIKGL